MKKLLLISIAALFLATGAAHAYPPRYYDCGRAFLKVQAGKGTAPSGRRVFPRTFTIQEKRGRPPLGERAMTAAERQRRCRRERW